MDINLLIIKYRREQKETHFLLNSKFEEKKHKQKFPKTIWVFYFVLFYKVIKFIDIYFILFLNVFYCSIYCNLFA